ncbi:uncharacterized protein NECHADRAFT_39842 [Fusarium vanettenii 77-13-4]|uniref:X-Pro dipeptidyl-peptidase n=1 Tax=Fusarium vanettenii (strain ATCC MYA-4622 / CBS 123669 / FGSC 9596 / NRRL 45880 / 77-13-4) TaxID=660122 RepID=C7Z0I3_FUSV7|nr:uncharacterized protein NECHADRAFT_39842 [Fusarium vanettenii 77-13-4]EEU42385.1 hypothetical protein NECHADRAFT_39842 [Fusarium vanettenii 77-13-4]
MNEDVESMADRVRRVRSDSRDLRNYYNIKISERRHKRLSQFYKDELDALFQVPFQDLGQQGRADFLLLRNYLKRGQRQLNLDQKAQEAAMPLLPFASIIVSLCESRQDVKPMEAEKTAELLNKVAVETSNVQHQVEEGKVKVSKHSAHKAVQIVAELRKHLHEFLSFYTTYDPMFDWWATTPWREANAALQHYQSVVQSRLAGVRHDGHDEIFGQPIGRDGLLVELEAEMIPYAPEALIDIAKEQYKWCEAQMKKASKELNFGDDWKKALEHVKTKSVPPGEQTQLVLQLAREGTSFVREHNLVTVPEIADETYRMFMMSPERQKESPFFLGGPSILVASPTADMSHELKKMVMRGNNRHFSRATAFHELIPGHRLQLFMGERHHSHRQMFTTSFFVEGWAMYWEMVFWEMGNFFISPEDRIGTLFWRMHRCARIIFSLKSHLGEMTPQECIDLLVDWVGHEPSNAEAEVRRSFNGDYSPLYQVGYMIGALQMMELRKEVLSSRNYSEKEFHDCVLRANTMPIELLRALLLGLDLTPDYKAQWRFYSS